MYERSERPTAESVGGFGAGEQIPAAMPPLSPIDWWVLDRVERADTLRVLSVFVPELVRRYGLGDSVVPPCWYQHEALIQELLGLFQLRKQAHFLESAPATSPNDFHVQLHMWVARMRAWVADSGCNAAQHHSPSLPSWVVPGQRQALWETDVHEFIAHGMQTGWPGWAPEETEGDDDE